MLDGMRIDSLDALDLEPSKREEQLSQGGATARNVLLTRPSAVRRSVRHLSPGRSAMQSTSTVQAAPIEVPLCTPLRLAPHELDAFVHDVRQLADAGQFRGGVHERTVRRLLRAELGVPDDHRLLTTRTGTDALAIALALAGVRAGAHVAVPALAYHAVSASVARAGAVPVWVDADAETWNISPQSLADVLRRGGAAAVVAVDNLGTPCDVAQVAEFCDAHEVPLILDACESLRRFPTGLAGADNVSVVWSFSFTKPVHALGMGGALATRAAAVDDPVNDKRLLLGHSLLPEPNAAYLKYAIGHLDEATARLRHVYASYSEVVTDLGWAPQPDRFGSSRRACAAFLLGDARERGDAVRRLEAAGIEVRVQFPLQTAFFPGICRAPLAIAEMLSGRLLSFPSGAGISDADVDAVAASIRRLPPLNAARASGGRSARGRPRRSCAGAT
jgi:dTDP-4-amino-4,6-dideoxygalactose transaminase